MSNVNDYLSALAAALSYAARGWAVFPCKPKGKEPLTTHGVKDATTDPETIRAWWARWPSANVAIACGPSGLVVIDADGEEGLASLRGLAVPKDVPTVRTAKGLHLYFAANGHTLRPAVRFRPGLDLRAGESYVIAPPSVHPSGKRYEWADFLSPDHVPPPPFPEALAAPRPAGGAPPLPDRILQGRRNATLTSLAGSMRRRGASQEAIEAALLQENALRCDPPLPDEEVRQIAASVAKYEPASPVGADALTDMGNARGFAKMFAGRLKYVKAWGWLVWDGKRWARDETGAVMRCAKEYVLSLYERAQQAYAAGDPESAKDLALHAVRCQSAARLEAMLRLAESEEELVARPEDFDRDPWLFNCANGTLDLRTGELRPHRPEDMLTKCSPVAYDPEARDPVWERYLQETCQGNADLIAYLQRAAGYSLTGLCDEETVFLVLGPAATGKTTFVEALLTVWGDYAYKIPFDALLERGKDGVGRPRPEVARLVGVRLAAACEASENKRIDGALLKELSGRDTITARFLYRDEFSFKPQHKLWLATNHAPQMNDADDALWRRIRRVPFEHTVPEERRDPKVKAHLTDPQAAGPAVLAWAVQGCLAWQREGLGYPPLIRQKTSELRASFDPLAEFFSENCVFAPGLETEAKVLRQAYETWAQEAGARPIGDREWGQRLQARGCQKAKRTYQGRQVKVWRGVGLLASEDPTDRGPNATEKAPTDNAPVPPVPVKADFPQNPLKGKFQTFCPKRPFTGTTGTGDGTDTTVTDPGPPLCADCGAEAVAFSTTDARPLCRACAEAEGMTVAYEEATRD